MMRHSQADTASITSDEPRREACPGDPD